MTRKSFVGALLDAISTLAALGNDSPLDSIGKFDDLKAGIFFEVDEDGTNQINHYILVELKDGTKWRIIPERALKLKEHEEILWNQYENFTSGDEIKYLEKTKESDPEDVDENEFLPDPDIDTTEPDIGEQPNQGNFGEEE